MADRPGAAGAVTGPVAALLADGRRLHLHHGPIDLVIGADGAPGEVARGYAQAEARFANILPALVGELPRLRSACPPDGLGLNGPVARRMEAAVRPHAAGFITPMAAVAGAVADEMLAALTAGRRLIRAYVNNGGDIALALAPGQIFVIGLVADPREARVVGRLRVGAGDPARGVATSGRHGRSLSLGIADAVTVLAVNAATADAAATMIANAVDLPDNGKVTRAPACRIDPDSDLGDRPVVVDIEPLTPAEARAALDHGATVAGTLINRGLIAGAALCLAGEVALVGHSRMLSLDTANPTPSGDTDRA